MRFFCVTRDDLSEINDSLRRACETRDVEYVDVRPTMLWLPLTSGPQPGDLLYRPATDAAAEATEAVLRLPGVVTFDREPGLVATAPLARYVQAGLPVPRTVFNLLPRRQSLADAVAALGGLPVVLKAPGGEGGAGVIRVESWDTLFALADYLPSTTVMQEYFEHAAAYRLVVVGERVVACEARYPGPHDFRTNSRESGELGSVRAPAGAEELAIAATRINAVEFGGADILANREGEIVLAELNSPCYFPDTERTTGIDIAGAMLDHLIEKAS